MSGVSITVNPLPEVYIGSDQNICQGTSAKVDFGIINGTANYSIVYKYYPLASPSSFVNVPMSGLTSLNDTLMVSPSQTTVYSITSVTDSKGCKATVDLTKEVTIVVTPRPNVTVTGVTQPIIICSGKPVGASLVSTVVGTTGTSFNWTVATPPNKVLGITNPGAGVVIADALENNSGKDATVKYTVTPTYLGCNGSSIDIPVKVRAKTEPLLLDKDNICPNDVVKLKTGIFPSGVSPLGTYTWDVDGVTQASNRDTLDIVVDRNALVTVIYTDLCGDDHVSNAAVLNTKQEVTITYVHGDSCMNSVTPFSPVNISDASNTTVIDTWKWNFGNYIVSGDSAVSTKAYPETTFEYNAVGTYNVTLKAISEGCEVGKVIEPIKIKDCTVKVKNTITPNGDGANEYWVIEEIENYPTASVEIFNRWGVLIWSCDGNCTKKNFAGRNEQGQELEQGTYYYVLTLNKGKSIMKGYISVIRDPGN
jgi:gliding motility-associated-like protein